MGLCLRLRVSPFERRARSFEGRELRARVQRRSAELLILASAVVCRGLHPLLRPTAGRPLKIPAARMGMVCATQCASLCEAT